MSYIGGQSPDSVLVSNPRAKHSLFSLQLFGLSQVQSGSWTNSPQTCCRLRLRIGLSNVSKSHLYAVHFADVENEISKILAYSRVAV